METLVTRRAPESLGGRPDTKCQMESLPFCIESIVGRVEPRERQASFYVGTTMDSMETSIIYTRPTEAVNLEWRLVSLTYDNFGHCDITVMSIRRWLS